MGLLYRETNKIMVVVRWVALDKQELHFYNSKEEFEKWVNHFREGAIEVLKKYELKEFK